MKPYAKFVLAGALALNLVGCAITTLETQNLNPDETSTVETPTINPDGTPFGPWIGGGTPWVFYGECWYYNGLLYGYYGNYGWLPFGYYPIAYLVKPVFYYSNAAVVNFYRNNPDLVRKASQQYYSAQRRDAVVARSGNIRHVAHSGGSLAVAHSGNIRHVVHSGGSRAVSVGQHSSVTSTRSSRSTSRTSTSKKAKK